MCVCFVNVFRLHLLNYPKYDMQVVSDNRTKLKILEACHNDSVGGCHSDGTKLLLNIRYQLDTFGRQLIKM